MVVCESWEGNREWCKQGLRRGWKFFIKKMIKMKKELSKIPMIELSLNEITKNLELMRL